MRDTPRLGYDSPQIDLAPGFIPQGWETGLSDGILAEDIEESGQWNKFLKTASCKLAVFAFLNGAILTRSILVAWNIGTLVLVAGRPVILTGRPSVLPLLTSKLDAHPR